MYKPGTKAIHSAVPLSFTEIIELEAWRDCVGFSSKYLICIGLEASNKLVSVVTLFEHPLIGAISIPEVMVYKRLSPP